MATFLRLSSCSSSAMVDMEKVVSINSGDLLYRAMLRPNCSSLPEPDNLKNDHCVNAELYCVLFFFELSYKAIVIWEATSSCKSKP